ncbi:hypothetical protein [Streptomyces sp. NRRL F-5135]|uniref:hypothetical protein n=1 Tax=Streptomyces sp. NRRL F-5135 TaxID=1463858 RepID=UPI0004C5644B|nr:hypothetical protein [Streptomyces sp. NRRL F-5135]
MASYDAQGAAPRVLAAVDDQAPPTGGPATALVAVAAVDDMAADEAGPRSLAATEAPRVLAAIDDQAV